MRAIFVSPSTRNATRGPKSRSISARVVRVSSSVSCKKACDNRVFVDAQFEQDAGDFKGVNQVRLAGKPFLAIVDLGCKHIGALKPLEIGLRIVVEHAIGDVVKSKHTEPKKPYVTGSYSIGDTRESTRGDAVGQREAQT